MTIALIAHTVSGLVEDDRPRSQLTSGGHLMNTPKPMLAALISAGFCIATAGCGSFEEAGENIDEGVEEVGDEIEDAGDEIEEETDDID